PSFSVVVSITSSITDTMIAIFFPYTTLFRSVAVPFSRIWQQVLRDKQATTLFSQLKRLLSLLLQLALLALMLLALGDPRTTQNLDRKSTRLNSSHVKISYAVFCLKKKNHTSL